VHADAIRQAVSEKEDWDVTVVGGGIVGLATALRLAEHKSGRFLLVEAEKEIGRHQSGHNSGVLHSGIYYRPGSEKAELCLRGRTMMTAFCDEAGIPWKQCGKVIVATDRREVETLESIRGRGVANSVPCELLNTDGLRRREPAAGGLAALYVPSTGIVDYSLVCKSMAERFRQLGGHIRTGCPVSSIEPTDRGVVLHSLSGETIRARSAIACAGLQSDRLFQATRRHTPATTPLAAGPNQWATMEDEIQIVPFRGEYYRLRQDRRRLCRHLIYPVPDPAFPFLGVHLTRMIDGEVECGPNAVLALSRAGYRWRDVSWQDLSATMRFAGFRRLASRHWRMGLGEMTRSLNKRSFAAAARRLVPAITADDLIPSRAGVRAQAVRRSGELVDDFLFADSPGVTHVLNAPSPAATASLAIAERIVERHFAASASH